MSGVAADRSLAAARTWATRYLNYVAVWLPMLALVLASAIFIWRKTYRDLPLFFSYIVSAWLIGILRYVAYYMSRTAYFYVYWISELAGAVIVSLALYEVFLRRLFPRFYQVRFYRNLFPMVALVVLILTIITALQAADRRAALLSASRALDLVRTSALVFFVGLMTVMGRQWTRYDFGIALGFGLQAAAALLSAAVRTKIHNATFLNNIEVIAYDVSCLIWLVTFWKPEKHLVPAAADDRIAPGTLHEARKWEQVLKNFLTPGK